jgi:serine phosphatase RsbU (regulator of sigma subunit)
LKIITFEKELKPERNMKYLVQNIKLSVVLVIIMFLLFPAFLFAQPSLKSKIKTGLIFKFTQNLRWRNVPKKDSFRIVVWGSELQFFEEMKKLSLQKRIQNLPLSVLMISNFDQLNSKMPHILYLCENENFQVKAISSKLVNTYTLLITNNCPQKEHVMINFLENGNKIDFEINRIAVGNQNIEISEKLILLGGAEVDVIQVYNRMQKTLDSTLNEIQKQTSLLDEQSYELELHKKELNTRKKDAILLQSQIKKQKENLKNLSDDIKKREIVLNQKIKQLITQQNEISKQEHEIIRQKNAINDQKITLDNQLDEIKQNIKIIASQKYSIGKQKERISTQRSTIELTILVIIIFGLSLFFIFRLYRLKIKNNNQLVNKNSEIQHQKEQIEQQSRDLLLTNQELQTKQEEISTQSEILQQINEELYTQAQILSEKNRQINASLRYAQTMQAVLLPPAQGVGSFYEYSVIHKPRELVSGDFFWFSDFSKKDDQFFIAAVADCTGHGVPGAFMSMIGTRVLNEIILEKEIKSPLQIIETVNSAIQTTLNQQYSDNTDGMDMSLISCRKQNSFIEINFCGAKLPIYLLKRKTGEIIRIKGDVKPIGGIYYDHISYTAKKILAESDDIIFLLSDGIIDQNSKTRKKFGTPKLIEMLKELEYMPFENHQRYVGEQILAHMDGVEQRDDMTLMMIHFI